MKQKLLSAVALLLAAVGLMTACAFVKPEDDRTVMVLEGEKIYYDYFRYVFLNSKADFDGGDDTYWTAHPEEETALKESVLSVLTKNRAIQLLAEEHGLSLTKEQIAEIEEGIRQAKAQYDNDEAFRQSLAEAHMTEYTLYYLQQFTRIWNDIYAYITNDANGIIQASDADIEADVAVNFRRIRYVYLEKDAEHPEASAARAEEVYRKATDGEDFNALIETYGEDDTMAGLLKYGYYYTTGMITTDVEEAVEAIGDNEIAPILEVSHGYFIIERLPVAGDYLTEHFDDIRAMYKARIFNEMVDERAKTLKIELKELYHTLTVATVN